MERGRCYPLPLRVCRRRIRNRARRPQHDRRKTRQPHHHPHPTTHRGTQGAWGGSDHSVAANHLGVTESTFGLRHWERTCTQSGGGGGKTLREETPASRLNIPTVLAKVDTVGGAHKCRHVWVADRKESDIVRCARGSPIGGTPLAMGTQKSGPSTVLDSQNNPHGKPKTCGEDRQDEVQGVIDLLLLRLHLHLLLLLHHNHRWGWGLRRCLHWGWLRRRCLC